MMAGMLMFISFPAIVSEWVALDSLASSLRNETLRDKRVSRTAKLLADGCVKFLLVFHSLHRRGHAVSKERVLTSYGHSTPLECVRGVFFFIDILLRWSKQQIIGDANTSTR